MEFSTIDLDRQQDAALYLQLCDALVSAIDDGELVPGERLPSERDLARQLGVSRTTVINAYDELRARGLVRGQVGRGTFVDARPDHTDAPFAWRGKVSLGALRTLDPTLRWITNVASDTSMISFAPALPAIDIFPVDKLKDAVADALDRYPLRALTLSPTEGQPELRKAAAKRIGARPEQILIVSGAMQGIDLVARCLLDPGDTVIMDRPGYLGAIQTFRASGASIIGWDIERADVDELEDLLMRYRPKLLYTNPTFQNPTGRVMPRGVRQDLLDLANRYRLPIVEDEPYRELGFDGSPPPTLYSLDRNALVIHLHTFSKTLAGGFRMGFLAAAEEIIDQLALFKQRSDVTSPSLEQFIVARMLTGDFFDRHMERLRIEHKRRAGAMLAALERNVPAGTLSIDPVVGGLYIWVTMRGRQDGYELLRRSESAGVVFVPGETFYPDVAGKNQFRLCFAAVTPERIDEGIAKLGPLISPR
ncbi:MAG: PLP-dependent aminotransferase family protein [Thermomicrobiales bacterium]